MGAAGTTVIRQSAFRGRIGVSRFDITPPLGIYSRMWGAAEHETAEGVHRPLTGTAIVFGAASGTTQLVLVSLDLGWWRSAEDEWFVRGFVLESLGLESHKLIIALTHTHAGPSISLAHADRTGGKLIEPYLRRLRESIVAAIQQARVNAVPATLAWAMGRCAMAGNRHLRSPWCERSVAGYNPAVEVDDALLVGRVTTSAGSVLATIVNYACHLTTLGPGNRLISPDYVGAMREIVEGHTGGAPCLFLQGASGELAPKLQYTDDLSLADQNGREVGYAVLSTLESMLPHETAYRYSGILESGATLGIWTYEKMEPSEWLEAKQISVELPLKRSPPILRVVDDEIGFDRRVYIERFERAHHLQQLVRNKHALAIPTWIWWLGDSALVAVPAECYSDFQIKLRSLHPEMPMTLINVSNGYYGYVPTLTQYGSENYEVQVSLLAAGCLEKLTEAVESTLSGSAVHISHSATAQPLRSAE